MRNFISSTLKSTANLVETGTAVNPLGYFKYYNQKCYTWWNSETYQQNWIKDETYEKNRKYATIAGAVIGTLFAINMSADNVHDNVANTTIKIGMLGTSGAIIAYFAHFTVPFIGGTYLLVKGTDLLRQYKLKRQFTQYKGDLSFEVWKSQKYPYREHYSTYDSEERE